jgi:hypothetical protein
MNNTIVATEQRLIALQRECKALRNLCTKYEDRWKLQEECNEIEKEYGKKLNEYNKKNFIDRKKYNTNVVYYTNIIAKLARENCLMRNRFHSLETIIGKEDKLSFGALKQRWNSVKDILNDKDKLPKPNVNIKKLSNDELRVSNVNNIEKPKQSNIIKLPSIVNKSRNQKQISPWKY